MLLLAEAATDKRPVNKQLETQGLCAQLCFFLYLPWSIYVYNHAWVPSLLSAKAQTCVQNAWWNLAGAGGEATWAKPTIWVFEQKYLPSGRRSVAKQGPYNTKMLQWRLFYSSNMSEQALCQGCPNFSSSEPKWTLFISLSLQILLFCPRGFFAINANIAVFRPF